MAAAVVSVFFLVTLLLGGLSLFISREALSVNDLRQPRLNPASTIDVRRNIVESQSALFPDWIVFNIVFSGDGMRSAYKCVFQNNKTSPAIYAGTLSASGKRSYKCTVPRSIRRLSQLLTPALTKSEVNATGLSIDWTSRPHLARWNWLVYDSLSTAADVIVFAKNVNRPGRVRTPSTLSCVFTDESSSSKQVRTPVTSSDQEVFRCGHPHLLPEGTRISLTLEVLDAGRQRLIPSVASYVHKSKTAPLKSSSTSSASTPSATLCACTMVRNVGKFLKEWVMYHSSIGVEKFVLYDNDSDESFKGVVMELLDSGYNLETVFWPWPKAQEAGFSHSVVSSNPTCKWMMFMDVDEFMFSPHWANASNPSPDMLQTLLPRFHNPGSKQVGQVMIQCHDFGPSNQTKHPKNGVTQGYTCRRRMEERHKSIVLLEAVDESLQNSVHHFKIRAGVFKTKKLSVEQGVVNHYKYQAWEEFKTKFKRRVSTYVVDWTEKVNLSSKDRAPGLGVEAVEPEGWAMKFCEVVDTRLQLLTQKWFGRSMHNESSVKMAWER